MGNKLKFGAHIFLWTSKWSVKHMDLLRNASKLGLTCIEIAVGDEVSLNASLIRKTAKEYGVEIILSPGGVWPMDADISHDISEYRKKGMSWHKYWLDQCEASGAIAYTGAIYAHPGRVEKRSPSVDEFLRASENLNELASYAAMRGAKLVVEPMSHFRTHLINTPQQAYNLLKASDHSNLRIVLDTYHLVTEVRDFTQGIRLLFPYLWGLHACENDRGGPGGGLIPWRSIGETLRKLNFEGYCMLETYNSSVDDGNFAFSRGMFHKLCPDGDEFVRNGVSFLKSVFN